MNTTTIAPVEPGARTVKAIHRAIHRADVERSLYEVTRQVTSLGRAARAAFSDGADVVEVLDHVEDVVNACLRSTSALCLLIGDV